MSCSVETAGLPVFDGWPDAPCAYLQFGSNLAYESAFKRARQAGFACARLEGGHFHMLVEPGAVAGALLDLTRKFSFSVKFNFRAV